MTKHYKEITLKSGRVVYGFNPSATLRNKLGYKWEAYDTPEQAKARAQQADDAFQEFKRTGALAQRTIINKVSDLVSIYKETGRWRKIASVDNSRRAYEQSIASILDMIGSEPVPAITPLYAERFYTRLRSVMSDSKSNAVIKMCGLIWSNAHQLELVQTNPFGKLRLEAVPDRDVVWSDDDVMTFIRTADDNGLASIGTIALLALELCQRPSDVRQMTWANYQEGVFVFTQQKTGTQMNVPATPALESRLSGILSNRNPADTIAIYEGTGRPYTERLFRKKAQHVRELAGLPDQLKIMDLRRTGATILGNASCTADEIRAVTGHKSRQILNTYVRPDLRMALSAQNKRVAQK
jgi:integrase